MIAKVDTRNLENEIKELEAREKYLCHLYEEDEAGMPLEYTRVARELIQKEALLEALRRTQG